MAKKTTIEQERRWLLKKVPNEIWRYGSNKVDSTELDIHQFYKDGVRYRHTCNSENGKENWTKCEKKSVGLGVNVEENEQRITRKEFEKHEDDSNKSIRKQRHVATINNYDCMIDDFEGLSLCILEVEGVSMSETVHFPAWLEKYILMEVTGNSKFSNYELAEREDEEDDEVEDYGDEDVMAEEDVDEFEDELEDE